MTVLSIAETPDQARRTNLNLQVRSHKVDWYVRVELCHELPEEQTNYSIEQLGKHLQAPQIEHVTKCMETKQTCRLHRGRQTALQLERQWQWPESLAARPTLPLEANMIFTKRFRRDFMVLNYSSNRSKLGYKLLVIGSVEHLFMS